MKYKYFWRKSGLKKPYGDNILELINEYNPKNVLEVGVFCGVTARNICELLDKNHKNSFSYIGVDLFGNNKASSDDEIEPLFLKNQKFSNPFKTLFYNYIKKENLNSIESVHKLLEKFGDKIKLIQGDTREILENLSLESIEFAFLDGGHSYETVMNDLNILEKKLRKNAIILCDDYDGKTKIDSVTNAINDFVNKKGLLIEKKFQRFALIKIN
ncbi:MAG: class I SAM-dependent methyltransferase [Candidatus Pelagibacter sp.]